jgi:hypothetical protein
MRTLSFAITLVALVTVACGNGAAKDLEGRPPTDRGGAGGFGGGNGDDDPADQGCASSVAVPQKAKVDVIFVIDNSGSMTEELNQVRANVNSFAAKIDSFGLESHVVFIVKKGTAGNTVCVPAPLGGPACADNAPRFFHVDQSVDSNDSLELILSTYETKWKQHLRVESTKIFVEVTDDESDLSSQEFDQQLLAKQPAGMFGTAQRRKYVFHSIISKPSGTAAPTSALCPTAAGTSLQYQNLSVLTGGLMAEVCLTDYSPVLDNLAKNIVDSLSCELTYPKAEAGDPTKVVVRTSAPGKPPANLTQVTDGSKCAQVKDGWYYDDPANPTRIILCADACSAAGNGSKIEAVIGCAAPAPK